MNPIAKEIASYFGSGTMTEEEIIEHYGVGHLGGGHSGRYPWGSGGNDYQHSIDFLGRIEKLRRQGWTENAENIKKTFGMSMTEYRHEKTLSQNERRLADIKRAESLRDQGLNTSQIAREMKKNESSIRELFNAESKKNTLLAKETAEFLKKQVQEKKMIDVGADTEHDVNGLNISRNKMDTALYLLESQGYGVYPNRIPNVTNPNHQTTQLVLCDKDIKPKAGQKVPSEIYQYDKIKSLSEYISRDNGKTFEKKFNYPESMDSKRVKILLKDEKGLDGLPGGAKDGLVEIRRGVPDLDLGNSRYSQVRILVDGNKYIKGMAVYSDNVPDGYDLVFNTSKSSYDKALKPIKSDPENPFGSAIKDVDQGGQYWYDSKTGKRLGSKAESPNAKLGLINKRADEGDWTNWKDTLPSQFLSKQSKYMAKKQLDLAKAERLDEFNEIKSLTQPTIKKYYLENFAGKCDKDAVDLKAAALPGQKYHAIIPINTLGEKEVYAPQYKEGSKVALIRYPHAGTFEIPILTVNNKNSLANKIIGNKSIDAIGINKKVADQLSGADFDGDTVMVIPTHDRGNKVKISSRNQLEGLVGFDPKDKYQGEFVKETKDGKYYSRDGKLFRGMKNTNKEMGVISNLITDMTLGGATDNELARAVRHSMVVIDAEKHGLDYKASYIDNDIASLKKSYQLKYDKNGNLKSGGASTIISRAGGEIDIPKRQGQAKINIKGKSWYDSSKPEGSLLYTTAEPKKLYYADSKKDKNTGIVTIVKEDGKSIKYNPADKAQREKYTPVMHIDKKTGDVTFTNKAGDITYRKRTRTQKSTQMAETDDANSLVSANRNGMELLYADYANSMKSLANQARKEMVSTPSTRPDPSAKKKYAKEVSSLMAKYNDAAKNAPKERAAQRMSNVAVNAQKSKDPTMTGEDLRKYSQRTVSKYRNEVGTINRKNRAITIDDNEWTAIQAGAVSDHKLRNILRYTDADQLRQRAMPKKDNNSLSRTQVNRIKQMSISNFTIEQIAEKLGVSKSAVAKCLKEGE